MSASEIVRTRPAGRACWCAGRCPHVVETTGSKRQTEALLRQALIKAPDCVEARRMLAKLMGHNNEAQFALGHIDHAIETAGELPQLVLDRAIALRNQANIIPAIAEARRALTLEPGNVLCYAVLANALEGNGELEEAEQVCLEARKRLGIKAEMRRVYASVLLAKGEPDKAIELLDVPNAGPLELFDRGRAYETIGRYAEAWRDWMQAKALQRLAGHVYNRDWWNTYIAELTDVARPGRIRHARHNRFTCRDPKPLFITGFPRSGSTMLEAALSAHSAIEAGDELSALPDAIQVMPALFRTRVRYPSCLLAGGFPENEPAQLLLAEYYLLRARSKIAITNPHRKAEPKWFTDKMLSNELHWPLIRLLLPDAAIFQVQRHPLDVLVSNMSHSLIHGGSVSCSPESFSEHYVMVDELLQHYTGYPWINVTTIKYEGFVEHHEATLTLLLEQLGLKLEPACVEFHKNPWHSRTISHRQIKQPVSSKSVGRYKPFLEFLAPVLPTLQPVIERQGYDV